MKRKQAVLPGKWHLTMNSNGKIVVASEESATPDVVAGLTILFARVIANLLHTTESDARNLLALSYQEIT